MAYLVLIGQTSCPCCDGLVLWGWRGGVMCEGCEVCEVCGGVTSSVVSAGAGLSGGGGVSNH